MQTLTCHILWSHPHPEVSPFRHPFSSLFPKSGPNRCYQRKAHNRNECIFVFHKTQQALVPIQHPVDRGECLLFSPPHPVHLLPHFSTRVDCKNQFCSLHFASLKVPQAGPSNWMPVHHFQQGVNQGGQLYCVVARWHIYDRSASPWTHAV